MALSARITFYSGLLVLILALINVLTVESNISKEIAQVQKKYKRQVSIGSYPFFRLGRVGVSVVIRSQNKHKISLCKNDILKNIIIKKNIKKYENL